MDKNEKAFEFAADLTKQLITLSTGTIALTVTFLSKDMPKLTNAQVWMLKISWISYIFAMLFGIWALMALTGTLASQKGGEPNPMGRNIQIPTIALIVTFLAGTALIIAFGVSVVGGCP